MAKRHDIMDEASGERPKRPETPEERSAVSAKIRKLVAEGKDQNTAVAEALSMFGEGRLGPQGGYRRVKK